MKMQFGVKNGWRLAIAVVSFVGATDGLMAMERVSQLENEIMGVIAEFDKSNYDATTNDSYQKLRKLIPQYREAAFKGYFSIDGDAVQHARDDNDGLGYEHDQGFISISGVTKAIHNLALEILAPEKNASLYRSLLGLYNDLSAVSGSFISRWTMFYRATHPQN